MKLTAAILSVAMLSFSAHVSAEIFTSQSGDEFRTVDVASEGDELAVLHYDTGLEWLNVRETWGLSMKDVTNALQGDLQGWRLPTNEEVEVLISSFFPAGIIQMKFVTLSATIGPTIPLMNSAACSAMV